MKKILIVLTLISISGVLLAYNSLANTDDFMASKVNPAAMGVGNSGGISFLGVYDEDGIYEDDYTLFFNFDNFAYVLDQYGRRSSHRLALSAPITQINPNLYIGSSWDWNNKKFKSGKLSESILFRPTDYLSFGVVGNDLLNEERNYDLGIAVRPMLHDNNWIDRITLTADFNYDEEVSQPIVGIQTELVDGVKLGGSYDLDSEELGVDFGISFGNFRMGSNITADKDKKFSRGEYYLSSTDKVFRTFIGKKKNFFLDYKLKGEILEKNVTQKIGPFSIVMEKGKTLSGIINEIEKLKTNENVKGLVFKSGNFSAKFAQRIALKNALLDFKSSGKKIVFYYENISGANYAFAASVADEIYLNPIGSIDLKGLSVNMPYFKNLLDTLGIDVVNLRSHDFKTAGNVFSEAHMTEAERETYRLLLEDIYNEIVMMIKEGRGDKLKRPVVELIDNGPYWNAEKALELGLIDGTIYEDQLKKKVKENYNSAEIEEKYKKNIATTKWSKPKKEKIALIYAVGNIHSGKGISGKSIGSKTTSKEIKNAREDKSVKGIILRVDSGGGSAVASDVIAREIELCKTGKNKKPVIVSMGGAAASGGYYIAAMADKIIAQPTTITGSIGVIGIFPVFERLYEKIHINWDTIKKGKHSDLGSTHRQMTSEEKDIAEKAIHHFYDRFISIVAKGRDMETEKVHEVAQGRVWTGKQALKRGLIDALGGMDLAVKEMKKLASLDHDVKLIEFEGDDIDDSIKLSLKASNMIPESLRSIWELGAKMKQLDDEKYLMILPLAPEFK